MKRPDHQPEPAAVPLARQLEGLEQRIEEWIEDSRSRATELHAIVSSLRSDPLSPPAPESSGPSPGEARALEGLAALARDIGTLHDQAAVLGRLIAAAGVLAERSALFVVRDGSLRCWRGTGLGDVSPRSLTFPLDEDTLLSRAVSSCDVAWAGSSDPSAHPLLAALGDDGVHELAAAPLWVRDRVAAVLYADTREPAGWLAGSLAAAATLASLALEALPLRARHPRGAGAALSASGPHAPIIEQAAASDAAIAAARASASFVDFTPARADVSPPPPAPALGRAAAQDAAHGEGHAPAEDAGETPAQAASSKPAPSVVEEARRFARLLVSEILLYNEAEVAEGRLTTDLSNRLKEDIERSRTMYDQRITQHIPSARSFFDEELARGLAGGDKSVLGMT